MLPKNLKYGSRVQSAPAKSIRTNIAPQNADTCGLGTNLIINIPTRANLVLAPSESYLKFDLQVVNTSTAATEAKYRFDSCGAHGIIQRIRVFHGSNLLQDIDNYNLLAKMLFDLQVSTPASYGKYSITTGTRNDMLTETVAGVTVTTSINSGAIVGGGTANAPAYAAGPPIVYASTKKATYCLNLISLVGSLCQTQYLPLFALTSAPLRIEIQLVDSLVKGMAVQNVTGTTSAQSANLVLSNIEYIGNFIELSDEAMSMVSQSLEGQPLQFVVPDWRNYQYNQVLTNGIQVNFPIPAKFSSLRSLFITQRDRYNTVGYFPLSSVTNTTSSVYFRVGPNIMPPKAVSSLPEMFSECIKAIGTLGDLSFSPSIEIASYTQDTTTVLNNNTGDTGATIQSGSFYIGIDLENYANSSKDAVFSGMNTNTDDIYCVIQYGNSTATVRYDAFALFDTVLVFENGTGYARF